MVTSPNLGLVIWNLPSDPYDSVQLAGNLAKLDQHDHTSGRGVQISTAALADQAVTAAKLAPGVISTQTIPDASVTTSKLVDANVTTAKVANNAITEPLLNTNVLPVGTVIPFWTPNYSLYSGPSSGWVPCDGATYTAGQHTFTGIVGSVTVPDLRNKFILGADTAGTGTDAAHAPAIGYHNRDNSHSVDLSHTHGFTVPAVALLNIGGVTHTLDEEFTGTTASALTSTDIRPDFVGLLFLIKIKHG